MVKILLLTLLAGTVCVQNAISDSSTTNISQLISVLPFKPGESYKSAKSNLLKFAPNAKINVEMNKDSAIIGDLIKLPTPYPIPFKKTKSRISLAIKNGDISSISIEYKSIKNNIESVEYYFDKISSVFADIERNSNSYKTESTFDENAACWVKTCYKTLDYSLECYEYNAIPNCTESDCMIYKITISKESK